MSNGLSTWNKIKGFTLGIGLLAGGLFFLYAPENFREEFEKNFSFLNELGIGLIVLGGLFVLMPFSVRMRSLAGFAANGIFAGLSLFAATVSQPSSWEFYVVLAFGLFTGSFALYCFYTFVTGDDPYDH